MELLAFIAAVEFLIFSLFIEGESGSADFAVSYNLFLDESYTTEHERGAEPCNIFDVVTPNACNDGRIISFWPALLDSLPERETIVGSIKCSSLLHF